MNLRLLQLNIFKGKFYDNLLSFLKKKDYDILCLQEVSGNNVGFINIDIFEDLKEKLDLNGEISKNHNYAGDPSSYFGNAILFKKNLIASNKQEVWMKEFREIDPSDRDWSSHPRSALLLDFNMDGKTITVATTHMVWGITPDDKPYKIDQANILLNFVKNVTNPLILTGDFNVIPSTQIISSFSKELRNLTTESGITNTLDLRNHKIKDIRPDGLAVDYIFVSDDISVKEFSLTRDEISDHHGLSLSFEA